MPHRSVRRMVILVIALLVGSMSNVNAALNQGVTGIGLEELFPGSRFDPSVPSQLEVTGVAPADRPLRPDEIIRYFRALAERSPRAVLTTYARSHEGRELVYLAVGDEEVIARLDEFREEHLKRLDPRAHAGEFENARAVAWMAYGIHGDELSSPDAAAALAYWLVAGEDERARRLRRDLVILIDPCENPDGRARYLAQTTSFAHVKANPDPEDLAHASVWPWGRGNHFLFDLNRDWFSMVHPESARSEVIASWLPQLMVDSHEMGAHDTYLFSPPRHPFNPFLPMRNRVWREKFGADQARALDSRGYPYYTAEWNEEFFPGYGSSWISYHGSVGILYEMSRTTGTLIRKKGGTLRTFAQAVEHQVTSSVANLETLRENGKALLSNHLDSRKSAMEHGKDGPVRAWLFPFDRRHPGRMEGLADLLRRQGVDVLRLTGDSTDVANARDARTGEKIDTMTLPTGTILVRLDQPAGRMARVLLDPHVPMDAGFLLEEREYLERGKGSRIYDTTGWSLPLLYGVPAYWSEVVPEGDWNDQKPDHPAPPVPAGPFVAVVLDGDPDSTATVLAEMMRRGLTVSVAEKRFRIDGREFAPGSLVVRREGNPENMQEKLAEIAEAHGTEMFPVRSSKSQDGPDLGGGHFKTLIAPRIGIWTGQAISPSVYGGLWHLLDMRVGIRFSGLDLGRFQRTDLDRYNVLIFPPANGGWRTYRHLLGDEGIEKLKRWIESGGTAIGIDHGARFLADREIGITRARFRSQALQEHPPAVFGISASEAESAGPMQALGLRPEESVSEGGERTAPKAKRDNRESPYDVAPLIGPGAEPFTKGMSLCTPVSGKPVPMSEWLKPILPPGKKGPEADDLERCDRRLRLFMPRGTLLGVDLDEEFWMNWGLGSDATVWLAGTYALVAEKPVRTAAVFKDIDSLHRGGLLWPEGAGRIARTAYATREAVGRGQVVLFIEDPVFRGWMYESRRMLVNTILLGPGLGTKWSAPW